MTARHAAGIGIALRACVARAAPGRSFAALMRAIYPRIEAELACVDGWAPRGGTAVDVGAWYGPWTARMSMLAAEWGYQGSVLTGGSWVPLDGFDLTAHQHANAHVAERGLLGRLARPGERYINTVLFRRRLADGRVAEG
jgi:hypothetical protein